MPQLPQKPAIINGCADLIVWQRSIELAIECDRLSELLRKRRRYVLWDQVVRASISIPSNIAEGQGRVSRADNVRHLAIARGSLKELETLLVISRAVSSLPETDFARAAGYGQEVGKMLTALIKRLGTRDLRSESGHG